MMSNVQGWCGAISSRNCIRHSAHILSIVKRSLQKLRYEETAISMIVLNIFTYLMHCVSFLILNHLILAVNKNACYLAKLPPH